MCLEKLDWNKMGYALFADFSFGLLKGPSPLS